MSSTNFLLTSRLSGSSRRSSRHSFDPQMRPFLLLLFSPLFLILINDASAELALIETDQSETLCSSYSASFGLLPSARSEAATLPLVQMSSSFGCSPSTTNLSSSPFAALAHRGLCSFSDKALAASLSGPARVLFVINNEPTLFIPAPNKSLPTTLPTLVIALDDGLKLLKRTSVRVWAPAIFKFDPNVAIFAFISISLIVVGSLWSNYFADLETSNKSRSKSPSESSDSEEEEKVPFLYMNVKIALLYIAGACIMLVVLYFFYAYVVYFLIASYCVSAVASTVLCSNIVLNALGMPYGRIFNIPKVGHISLRKMGEILFAFAIVLFWVVARHDEYAWILQDFIGALLILTILRSLRLPNIKISAILLILFFIYDIFFVFITPLFTPDGESLMVKAATGGSTGGGKPAEVAPLVFLLPRFIDPYLGACGERGKSMLGFGDIVLPGLLVSFCLSFDISVGTWRHKLYFLTSLGAYLAGLGLTFVALSVTSSPQPALLYLVPCTLLSILFVGWRRGELKTLWIGTEKPQEAGYEEAQVLREGETDLEAEPL